MKEQVLTHILQQNRIKFNFELIVSIIVARSLLKSWNVESLSVLCYYSLQLTVNKQVVFRLIYVLAYYFPVCFARRPLEDHTDRNFQKECVSAHNQYRSRHNAPANRINRKVIRFLFTVENQQD